jgi:hypothetical protein
MKGSFFINNTEIKVYGNYPGYPMVSAISVLCSMGLDPKMAENLAKGPIGSNFTFKNGLIFWKDVGLFMFELLGMLTES